MSIPFYDDIYHFPGGYMQHHSHCHNHGHKFSPSYVKDTSKSVDIEDKFGNLKYVVELQSEVFASGRAYKVTVSQMLSSGLSAFLCIPENGYEQRYDEAIMAFDGCVMKYKSLVDAETRDFRDIKVYEKNIGYEVQRPQCCASCKWCMKTIEHSHHPWEHRPFHPKNDYVKMQCCNPKNEQVFNYAQNYPDFPRFRKEFCGWQKLPWQSPEDVHIGMPEWDPRKFPSIIFPVVDPFGKCDNYLSGECPWDKHSKPDLDPMSIADTIAPGFDQSKTYSIDDLVYYNGQLYRCIEDGFSGNWNPNAFQLTTIEEALQEKVSEDELDCALSHYVPNNALSAQSLPMNPNQHEVADVNSLS